jgi:hypothetical protein
MYALDLICSNGHKFESWFRSRCDFENQKDAGLITCPGCGDTAIEQALSPVRIGKHCGKRDEAQKPVIHPGLSHILKVIEREFEDVGGSFPEEALRIHFGESDRRNIRGTATPEEERELIEEGIEFFKIPELQ